MRKLTVKEKRIIFIHRLINVAYIILAIIAATWLRMSKDLETTIMTSIAVIVCIWFIFENINFIRNVKDEGIR